MEEVIFYVKDGMIVYIGGFIVCGILELIIIVFIEKGVKDLIIVVNDIGFIDKGIGRLVVNN